MCRRSKVVDDYEKLAEIPIVYHYCDFMIAESISPVTVLRDIFVQLLRLVDTDWTSDFEELIAAMNTQS